jgi:uncharacterized protein (TIGR02996 family)
MTESRWQVSSWMVAAFRYFEHVDEEAGRFQFWEIALDGPALAFRHGEVGSAGKHEIEMCASPEAARVEYEARIAAQIADGFRECADRRLDTRTRALEAAIAADPDDLASYVVYADWIQTLGDPRGGLIVAQAAAADDAQRLPLSARRRHLPAQREADARADAYMAEHVHRFLGPLAEHTGYDGSLLDLRWRWGYIHAAKLTARDLWTGQPERVFEQLLVHGSARWLQALEIELVDRDGTVEGTWPIQPVIDALAAHRLPFARRLAINKIGEVREQTEEAAYAYTPTWHADLSKLWPAVPGLRELVLSGDPAMLGDLGLPELERLELTACTLQREAVSAIAYGACPCLQRLAIRYRLYTFRGAVRPLLDPIAELEPLLESSLIRRLDQLAIIGIVGTDSLCRALSRIRRPALRELELSNSDMTDVGAEALAAAPLELDILDVTRNRLSPTGVAALEKIAKLVVAEQQYASR